MKLLPQIRFLEYSDFWNELAFNDIFKYLPTNSFSRAMLSKISGTIMNVHYGDIHTRYPTILNADVYEIPFLVNSIDISKIAKSSFCLDGDVIIADTSEDYLDVGKAIELVNVGDKMIVSGLHTILARDVSNILADRFRGYVLMSPRVRKQIKTLAAGIKVLGISKSNMSNVTIAFPSLPEQQRIASFLTLIDAKIDKQREKVDALKEYKKGLLQKIFSQEIRFKDNDGSDYPEWRYAKVSNLFTITRGVVIAKPTLSENQRTIHLYPVYSSQTMNNGILGFDSTYDFSGECLTWTTDGANAGRVFYRTGKFRCTNVCGVLLEKNTTKGFSNIIIKEILNRETPKHVSYVGNPKLMNGIMGNISIRVPNIAEQKRLSILLHLFESKIEKEMDKLMLLNEYKKGLLQQMFV